MKKTLLPILISALLLPVAFAGDCLHVGMTGQGELNFPTEEVPQHELGVATGTVTVTLDDTIYDMNVTATPMGSLSNFTLPGSATDGPLKFEGYMWVLEFEHPHGNFTAFGKGEMRQNPEVFTDFEALQSMDIKHGTGIFARATGRIFTRLRQDASGGAEVDLEIRQLAGVICGVRDEAIQFKK